MLGLVAKGFRQFLMLGPHLVVREGRQLFVPRLVGCDLRCRCSLQSLLLQVISDLLAAGTRCIEIRLRVALNLRLSAFAPLDLIAQLS